jgi:hypothetical protein
MRSRPYGPVVVSWFAFQSSNRALILSRASCSVFPQHSPTVGVGNTSVRSPFSIRNSRSIFAVWLMPPNLDYS